MANLLSLFSTDRRLLETRGNLIIRQLCLSLDTERIYCTIADILEHDEDLEFASIMVQNLNIILTTSSELSDLRKRLRNLDHKDGQRLFIVLYRSWCHNAVATFSLCLLAQAYEHAANMLQVLYVIFIRKKPANRYWLIFFSAELEITVSMLIQMDKLVQLLESPVFTCKTRKSYARPWKNWKRFWHVTYRSPPAVTGTREVSVSVQVSVWHPDAPAAIISIFNPTQPTE